LLEKERGKKLGARLEAKGNKKRNSRKFISLDKFLISFLEGCCGCKRERKKPDSSDRLYVEKKYERGTVFRCEPDASHTTHIDSVTFGHQTDKKNRRRGERSPKERNERLGKTL
jgi:hypothetical protein